MIVLWIESEHAVAFAADPPAVEGHIMVVPKQHISSIHVLPMAAQQGCGPWYLRHADGCAPGSCRTVVWMGLRRRYRYPHTVIHVVPRRTGDRVELLGAVT